ncbi:MAG TPA: hypothetical protein VF678_03190, partial [bacterium]
AALRGQSGAGPAAEPALRMPVCPAYQNLCVNADKNGVFDMNSGVAELEGDVRGYMGSQDLTFHSDLLRAMRDDAGDWKRMFLSNNVRMAQPNRRISAEHGVIEEETALFYGNARMVDDTSTSESDEIYLEHETERATLKGSPQRPVRMEYISKDPPRGQPPAAALGALPPAPPQPLPTKVRAQKVVVEEQSRMVTMTGKVYVEMPDKQMQLEGESVMLQFDDNNAILAFQARGDVVVTQPGRKLTADVARSQNRLATILLTGGAKAQQPGQFELNSERMEVFTDPKKGQVRSEDRQRPVNLSVDLGASKPYKLVESKLQSLADKGVPADTIGKLSPILGRSYGTQDALRDAVTDLLTQEETQRYMSTIISLAR